MDLDVKCKLFTDDLKLCAKRTEAYSDDLITALKRVSAWCESWQLNLAPEKCFVLQVANG